MQKSKKMKNIQEQIYLMKKVDKIDVDFNKISAIPSIYFSNSIGKLVEKYGLEFIEEKLHLSSYNFQMAGAINLAINLAIEKRKNKKYHTGLCFNLYYRICHNYAYKPNFMGK